MIPRTDPTHIIEHFRGDHGTELLAAAVAHFDLFSKLHRRSLTSEEFGQVFGLAPRAAAVLTAALRAMRLLDTDADGRFVLTPVAAEHLVPGEPFYIGDYIGLGGSEPGTLNMVERLRTNRPISSQPDEGAAYMYKAGVESAMDAEASARRLTLALAGRARNVAPVLAQRYPLEDAKCLLDVGGGTGIYAVEFLKANPNLRAVVWDRPAVLNVAKELAQGSGVEHRLELRPGDMFADPVPGGCDAVLLSNVLHDWDVPECDHIVSRCAGALPSGGRVLVHDVFLNDALDGPLPVALYSAALFSITEGRAYSGAEYRGMLSRAGLTPSDVIVPTLIHCGLLAAVKP
jgi:SAM-dependent methyltransferase